MSKVKPIAITNEVLAQNEFKPNDYSLLSLRVAIKSFFSTYKAMRYSQAVRYDEKMNARGDTDLAQPPMGYVIAYFETIIHFQHFFELFCKGILAIEHPLLAHRFSEKPELLLKVLKNEALSPKELANVHTIGMSQALDVLEALFKDEKSPVYQQYGFLKKYLAGLKKLNKLRNDILHGGQIKNVISYKECDDLIVNKILPLIGELEERPYLKFNSHLWRYRPLHCNIDPIKELVKDHKKSWQKIALLKELGRAAYENPMRIGIQPEASSGYVTFDSMENQQNSKIAKAKAETFIKTHSAPYTTCPVCGTDTMNVFYDNYEIPDPQKPHEIMGFESYPYSTECQCCTLELSPEIWAKSIHGYNGIDPEETDDEQK